MKFVIQDPKAESAKVPSGYPDDEAVRIGFLMFLKAGLDEISRALDSAIAKHKENKGE